MTLKSNRSIGILVFFLITGMILFFYWNDIRFIWNRHEMINGCKPIQANELNRLTKGDTFFFYIAHPSGTGFYNYQCIFDDTKIAMLRQESLMKNEDCDGCEVQTFYIFKALQTGETTILLKNEPETFTFPGLDIPIEIPIQIMESNSPNL